MSFAKLFERCLKNDHHALYFTRNYSFTDNDINYALEQLALIKENNVLYSQALFIRAWMCY